MCERVRTGPRSGIGWLITVAPTVGPKLFGVLAVAAVVGWHAATGRLADLIGPAAATLAVLVVVHALVAVAATAAARRHRGRQRAWARPRTTAATVRPAARVTDPVTVTVIRLGDPAPATSDQTYPPTLLALPAPIDLATEQHPTPAQPKRPAPTASTACEDAPEVWARLIRGTR